MLAAVFDGKNIVLKEDFDIPKIKDTEILIKVKAVGICGTDLSILKGTYQIPAPRILGHEFSGVVSEIGKKATKVQVGDRVTSEINITCGNCYFCKSGQRTQCLSVKAIGIYEEGAFAKYVKVPETNVHNIFDIPFQEATFIEPLAAAIQTFEMAPLGENDKTVIIGAGKLGLLILQVVRNKGRKAIVVGRSHLELAKQLGADIVISVEKDPVKRVMDETKNIGADVVVEATGTPESIDLALSLVRNRGTIDLKSTHGIRSMTDLTQIVVRELRLQGSRCGPFRPAIQMLQEGKIQVKPLISATFPLTQINEAIDAATKSKNVKIIIIP